MIKRVALLLCSAAPVIAPAADYPARPLRILTPFSAGSTTDIIARPIAARLTELWGQPVVVDNRAGAGGAIAAEITAKATPDGHTLMIGATGPNTVNPSLLKNLPYDSARAFAPITLTAVNNLLLAVPASLPAKTVKELIELAKSKPGQLRFASSGVGSSPHLAGELLKSLAGVDILHVPYKGSPQYLVDLLAARVDMSLGAAGPVIPHARAGRLRLLGVSASKRDPTLPEVPTIAEAGVPGFEVIGWYGLITTAGTPVPVVRKLHSEVLRILATPEVKVIYANAGMDAVSSKSPEEFANYIDGERAKWARVIKTAKLRIE